MCNDLAKHLSIGIAQYEDLESLGPRLGGQARRYSVISSNDYRDEVNTRHEEAITRKAKRAMWSTFYKTKAILLLSSLMDVHTWYHDLVKVHSTRAR